MFRALLVLLFVGATFAAPRQLVPHINTEDENGLGFRLEPTDDGYELNLNHDDALRVEAVQEIAPGVFLVKGELLHHYFESNIRLSVNYEAGPNGNVAKYKIESGVLPPQHLPASVLKAAAG